MTDAVLWATVRILIQDSESNAQLLHPACGTLLHSSALSPAASAVRSTKETVSCKTAAWIVVPWRVFTAALR